MNLGIMKENLIKEYNGIASRITEDNQALLIIQGRIAQIEDIQVALEKEEEGAARDSREEATEE